MCQMPGLGIYKEGFGVDFQPIGDLQGGLRGGFSADLGSDSDRFESNFGVDSGGFWRQCQVGSAHTLGSFWHLLVEFWNL